MAKLKKKKTRKLTTFFVRYTLWIFLMVPIVFGMVFGLYAAVQATGMVAPAPYDWQQLQSIEKQMRQADKLSAHYMTSDSVYAAFTGEGEYLYGNADAVQQAFLWDQYRRRGECVTQSFIIVNRDGEIRGAQFETNRPAFRNSWLRRYFPDPETTFVLLSIPFFICGVIILSVVFGRKLARRLKVLTAVTHKIQSQDLEFSIERSDIYEIDMVLRSMDDMKTALGEALTAQWSMEQARNEQMQALTHDIGTPLTIIRGNAELLEGSDSLEQAKEYGRFIVKNARLIGDYVATLNRLSHAELSAPPWTICDAPLIWDELVSLITAMCTAKRIHVVTEGTGSRHKIHCDPQAVLRAFGNVFSNAEYYTPDGGTISLRMEDKADAVCFIVQDSGPGFSPEALDRAAEQFFTEKEDDEGHGMGLYTAYTIVRQHNGSFSIYNDEAGGACVSICFPSVQGPEDD